MIDTGMKIIGGGSTPGMNNNSKPPSAPTVEGSSGPAQAPAPAGMSSQVDKTV